MGREKFKHGEKIVVVETMVKFHKFLETMKFLNFADDNRKWRLPGKGEILEFIEQHSDKVVDVAYRNRDNGNDFLWYFTADFRLGNYSDKSNVVVYDLDRKAFRDFYYTDAGILNCATLGWHNAILIGEDRNSLSGLEGEADGGGE